MTSLVADYSSSSDSENSIKENDLHSSGFQEAGRFPKPAFASTEDETISNLNETSVFANPYQQAERATLSALERHVRMTMPTEKQDEINGRQICWNYRKGKCRFGHNCKFAHDSDVPVDNRLEDERENNRIHTITCHITSSQITDENGNEEEDDDDDLNKKKKRPGLCPSLVPSKKVMKQYYRQQHIERPWTAIK